MCRRERDIAGELYNLERGVSALIRYFCDCGNNEPGGFDIYVSQGDLCDILTVVCKSCGEVNEELVACGSDSIVLLS